MFRKFDQNRNISKLSQILTNTEFFSKVSPKLNPSKIWPKSKFFENYHRIRNFSRILTKIEFFFKKFDQNWNFFEKLIKIEIEKIEIFRKFDSNRNCSKIFPQAEIFRKLDLNRHFSIFFQILTKTEFFSKIWQKAKFFEHSTKIEILTESKFPENFTKIELFSKKNENFRNFRKHRNFSNILTKIKIFRKFWPKRISFYKFDQNRNFWKIWPK